MIRICRICTICGSTYLPNSGSQKYCTDCIPRIAGDMSTDPTIIRICRLYLEGYSMHSIARKTGLSDQKIRRVLIQYGLYSNDTIKAVHDLHNDGKTIDQIAETLGMGRKAIIAMLPYNNRPYGLDRPTPNAAYLRHWRNKED